jgi:predicted nucleic acid-binding protein
MNYLDANFATALLFNIRGQTELAERFLRRSSLPFLLSELAELECRRAFTLRTGTAASENWTRFQGLIEDGAWRREPLQWSTVSGKARQLIERFGAKLRAGTLDTLHVAQALISGCTFFLSFDSNSNARVLAAACRLRVFPELSDREHSLLAR